MVTMLLLHQRGAAYTIRRQLGTAFRNGVSTNSLSQLPRTTLSDQRLRSFSLGALKRDPDSSYSLDDLAARARSGNERPMPPILDSQDEDEGYGAYDYVPDIYDQQEMNQQDTLPDEFLQSPPVKDATKPKVSQNPKPTIRAPVNAPVSASTPSKKVSISKAIPVVKEEPVEFVGNPDIVEEEAAVPVPAPSVAPTLFKSIEEPTMPWSRLVPPPRSEMMMEKEASVPTVAPPTPADKPNGEPDMYRSRHSPPPRSEMMTTATHFHAARVVTGTMGGYLEKAAYGKGAMTEVDVIKQQMVEMEQAIYLQNNGKEFNINSPKQCSIVLYGFSGESTNKDALESMGGGGHKLADLILQHRNLKASVKRMERRQTNKDNNTHVRSAMTVARPNEVTEHAADPLILVDASAYIFRAYYSMPPIHRSDGMPTGAVLGFCNMLNRLILNRMVGGERPRLVLVFDAKGKTFRHDLYPEYKGNRPSAPMDLIPQFDLIRDVATAYGICQLEANSFEADDVIATLVTMALEEGVDTNILSGDKDLMQLVTAKDDMPSCHIIDPMTMSRVTYDQVVEKWGVPPEHLGDLLALAGDSSDNIPGVPGIGPKIAAALIDEFGSLEKLLEQVDSVKQKARREKLKANVDQARLSRILVELERKVPMEIMTFPEGIVKAGELRMEAIDGDRLMKMYDQMGFKDLKRRVEPRLKQGASGSAPKPPASKKSYSGRIKTEVPKPEDYADVPF
jgi:5'-3' exonuclease